MANHFGGSLAGGDVCSGGTDVSFSFFFLMSMPKDRCRNRPLADLRSRGLTTAPR